MVKWEYTTVLIVNSYHIPQNSLDLLGCEGWELVQIVCWKDPGHSSASKGARAYFKRPLVQNEAPMTPDDVPY